MSRIEQDFQDFQDYSVVTVGRGPVPRHASVAETALGSVRFSRGSSDRGGQAPARRLSRPSPFTVGRGPVPRHASVGKMALGSVRFSRRSTIAWDRPSRDGLQGRLRFTVGRGPVPRHASIGETALVGVRFSRRSSNRGGQAPARRAREGFSSPCAVREQTLPNYSLLKVRRTIMSIEYAARQVLKVL